MAPEDPSRTLFFGQIPLAAGSLGVAPGCAFGLLAWPIDPFFLWTQLQDEGA